MANKSLLIAKIITFSYNLIPMKKKNTVLVVLASSFLVCGAFLGVKGKAYKADATYDTSTPTRDIDLNDCSESEIKSYYSSVNGKSGNQLLIALKDRLKNGQKYFSYDSGGTNIWKIYEIVDRDWAKSPASEITGYNATTNKITNYTYGSSASNSGSNPYLHALYVDREMENQMHAWALEGTSTTSHGGNNEWCIDREHIWAKSHGFPEKVNGTSTGRGAGAAGDLMHLWPGDSGVNSALHSDNYYGYVDKNNADFSGYTWSYTKGNYSGPSSTITTSSETVFEPQDADKGDIARAIFYMVARYNYLSGSDSDGIDVNNPNLALYQGAEDTQSSSYVATTTLTGKMGILTDLLAWHHADPVDEFEIHRNNLLYRNYTKNRNPFIDFPEWVDYIWGTATYNDRQYISYDSTPTGSVDLDTDVINGYKGETGVSLQLSAYSLDLEPGGETATLNATASDSNSYTVSWSSSNTAVATVSSASTSTGTDVTITSVGEGSAVVTASITVNDKVISKKCTVNVATPEIEVGDVNVSIGKTDYAEGYASSGTSGSITKTVATANDLTINYSGINTKGSATGSAYGYTMYTNSNGFAYSNNCPSGYYPSNVTVNFSSTTGISGKVGIKFTTAVSSTRDSTVTGAVTKSGSYSVDNTDVNKKYWNFSTDGANVQVSSISITYSPSNVAVSSVSLDNSELELGTGQTTSLTATIAPKNATDKTVSWHSSNTNVATVNGGVVTAVGAGSATITVTTNDGNKTATCVVTVTTPVTGVSLNKSSTTIALNSSETLTATVSPAGATNKNVIWSSSNTSVATVNNGVVNAIGIGSAIITVTTEEGDYEDSCTVTVSSGSAHAGDIVAAVSISSYASTNNWSNGVAYLTLDLDSHIEITTSGGGNTGKYYTAGHEWRFYQTNNSTITVKVKDAYAEQYVLDDVVFAYTIASTGILMDGSTSVASGTLVAINGTSKTFTMGNTGSATNGQVKITSISASYHSTTTPADPVTSISASVSKTYAVGETIALADIVVKDQLNRNVSGFAFANDGYQFKYTDAASGGALTNKTFTNAITYSTFVCSLTVQVKRNAYVAPSGDVTISLSTANHDFDNLNGTSSSPVTNTFEKDNITFEATNSYKYSNTLAFKTFSSGGKYATNGQLYNTTPFPGAIKAQVTYTITGGVTISPTIEYTNDIDDDSSWTSSYVGMHHFRIRYEGTFTGYINVESVSVTYYGADTAVSLSNYIMYEDTNNQCTSKFDVARGYFENMSSAERNTFVNSDDYVIATARERFEAWARHLNKSIVEENSDYVIKPSPMHYFGGLNEENQALLLLTMIISGTSLLGLGLFLYKRKKHYLNNDK